MARSRKRGVWDTHRIVKFGMDHPWGHWLWFRKSQFEGPCEDHKRVIFGHFWDYCLLIHWVVNWKPGHSCRPLVLFFNAWLFWDSFILYTLYSWVIIQYFCYLSLLLLYLDWFKFTLFLHIISIKFSFGLGFDNIFNQSNK